MFAVESPRYRFTKKNQEDFAKDMMYIAKLNGKTLTEKDKLSIRVDTANEITP